MPFLPDFVQINVGFSLPRNRSPGIYCGGEKGLLYLLFLLIFNRLKDQCSWYLFFSLSLRGYHYQTPKLTRDDLALIWIIKPSHNNKAVKTLFKWLNRRSQRKSFNWEKFSLFVEKNPLPKIKVYHPFF